MLCNASVFSADIGETQLHFKLTETSKFFFITACNHNVCLCLIVLTCFCFFSLFFTHLSMKLPVGGKKTYYREMQLFSEETKKSFTMWNWFCFNLLMEKVIHSKVLL